MSPEDAALQERVANALSDLVDRAAAELLTLDEAATMRRRAPASWCVKEILGHLVDSAANNHQRFVRAQESSPYGGPGYTQMHWVSSQGYAHASWPELVELWRLYNRHLARVIRRVPDAALATPCTIASDPPVTLGFVIEDYVTHMRHHLTQIRELLGAHAAHH